MTQISKDWMEKGHVLFDKGKFNEAIERYKRALSNEPENVDALINIGLSYRHLEEYDKAIDFYYKVLEIEPENKTSVNNIGYALECKGNIDEAVEMYKKSLEIDPSYDIPLVNLSNIYFEKKDYENVVFLFKRALKNDAIVVPNWIDLGRAYRHLKMYDESIEAYSQALKLDSNNRIAWNNLGFVYFKKEEYDRAIEAYTKSLEVDWLYQLPYTNVLKLYNTLIEKDIKDSKLWINLAKTFLVARAHIRGIDSINRAINIDPENEEAIKLHKKILKIKKKFDLTPFLVDKIEKALELFSIISTTVFLSDIIDYVKFKNPDLDFKDEDIKFNIFETIKERGINAKLDKKKLIFYQKPIDNPKIDYLK